MIVIKGKSSSRICLDGDIRQEFYLQERRKGDFLAFSDGTLLRIQFTDSCAWRITVVVKGRGKLEIDQAEEAGTSLRSDEATLHGDVAWVLHGVDSRVR